MKNLNKLNLNSKFKSLIGLIFLHFLFWFGFLHHNVDLRFFVCSAVAVSENNFEIEPAAASEELLKALKGDVLVIGMDPDFPPMGKLNGSGEVEGADVDLAKAVAQKMGVKAVFQPINWDAKEVEVNSGRVHVLWNGFSKTPEREEAFLLSKPYMENNQQIIVKKNSGIKTLANLEQKQVCLQKGSSAEGSFESSSLAKLVKNLVKLESCVDCLNEVRQGKCDAAVVDEVVARFYLNKGSCADEFEVLPEVLSKEAFVVGMKKGNVVLCEAIEKAYNELALENFEVLQGISKKWFGKQLFLKRMGVVSEQVFEKPVPETEGLKGKTGLFSGLFAGFVVTLKLFGLCLLFSLPLGFAFCLLKNLKIKPLSVLINIYVAVMRGTPLLLQLFFAFYGLPMLIPGLVLKNRFLVGLFVFVFNYAAYFAEIFRGGLVSISQGQFESVEILQIPKFKAAFRIFLPQMLKVCLPSICNETISLVKDTALIFALGVVEFLTMAKNMVNSTADVSIYFIVAVVYLLFCSLLNFAFSLLEKKFKF